MKIHFDYDDTTVIIEAEKGDTVLSVKQKLFKETGISIEDQTWAYSGKRLKLDDDKKLEDFKSSQGKLIFDDESVIALLTPLTSRSIYFKVGAKTVDITINKKTDLVYAVKEMLFDATGIPAEDQLWTWGGTPFAEDNWQKVGEIKYFNGKHNAAHLHQKSLINKKEKTNTASPSASDTVCSSQSQENENISGFFPSPKWAAEAKEKAALSSFSSAMFPSPEKKPLPFLTNSYEDDDLYGEPSSTASTSTKTPEKKLLVLDIQGTLLTTHSISMKSWELGVHKNIPELLKWFKEQGFEIFLAPSATPTPNEWQTLQNLLQEHNIMQYLSLFRSPNADKIDALKEHCEKEKINKNNVYFFDDVKSYIDKAKAADFSNAFLVTGGLSLDRQLEELKREHSKMLSSHHG